MMDMNIEKNPQPFSQLFPVECEKHFNLLAKQRFKSGTSEATSEPSAPSVGQGSGDDEEQKVEGEENKAGVQIIDIPVRLSLGGGGCSRAERIIIVISVARQWTNVQRSNLFY
jgi:hypothetical protein